MSETVVAWRIVKASHAANACDGEGARLYGGRWNSAGTALVYTAESRALAMLEMLVHLPAVGLLGLFVLVPVRFDAGLVIELTAGQLPADWRAEPAPASTRQLGDDWAASKASAVWKVPSAVVRQEANYLLNPAHPKFAELVIGKPEPVKFDARLIKGG